VGFEDERQPTSGSNIDDISKPTSGIYKLEPPKDYRSKGNIA
jgi:hypothetical protein